METGVDADSEVVIVGGGIAGASLAYSLASAGLPISLIEATTEFVDRVRGESMHAWGVREAQRLGVEPILMDAGAHIAPTWHQYASGTLLAELPMHAMVPGVAGTLNVRHPVACQALLDAAASAGASVRRGVEHVEVVGGRPATVRYEWQGETVEHVTPLVVGADGRASTVRRGIGMSLDRQDPVSWISGMLVDGVGDVPGDFDILASGDGYVFLMVRQRGGLARLYYCPGESRRREFSGPQAADHLLQACHHAEYPWAEEVAQAKPVGPCATYPGDHSWTDTPYRDGVVLVGDAAGHSDPIAGQGLSIGLRDVRLVSEAILDSRQSPDFRDYAAERSHRMAVLRLAASVISVAMVEDCDNRRARLFHLQQAMTAEHSTLESVLQAVWRGPETTPKEAIDTSILDSIRAA